MLRLLAQEQRASMFSEQLAGLRFVRPFAISGAFLGYCAMEAYHGHNSVFKASGWLVSWVVAYWIGRHAINLVAYVMGPYVLIDLPNLIPRLAPLPKEAESFERAIGQYTGGRRFCITEQGYMGWVSLVAREGDEVATFYGTRILYTLRREDKGFQAHG